MCRGFRVRYVGGLGVGCVEEFRRRVCRILKNICNLYREKCSLESTCDEVSSDKIL